MKHLATQESASGLLFAGIGVLGIVLSLEEQIGTAARMGSGFMPLVLSCGLVAMGLIIIFNGLRKSEPAERQSGLRPVVMVVLAIVAFALSIRTLGLAPAVFIATVVACYAEPRSSLPGVLLFSGLLAGFCCLVFLWGLGLIIPAFVMPWTF